MPLKIVVIYPIIYNFSNRQKSNPHSKISQRKPSHILSNIHPEGRGKHLLTTTQPDTKNYVEAGKPVHFLSSKSMGLSRNCAPKITSRIQIDYKNFPCKFIKWNFAKRKQSFEPDKIEVIYQN
jgi:hypothetical protein